MKTDKRFFLAIIGIVILTHAVFASLEFTTLLISISEVLWADILKWIPLMFVLWALHFILLLCHKKHSSFDLIFKLFFSSLIAFPAWIIMGLIFSLVQASFIEGFLAGFFFYIEFYLIASFITFTID